MTPILVVASLKPATDPDALLKDVVMQVLDMLAPCFPRDYPPEVTVEVTPSRTYLARITGRHGTTSVPVSVVTPGLVGL